MKLTLKEVSTELKGLIKIFTIQFKESAFHMIFFAILFSMLGYYIPKAYFTWFDHTSYYSIKVPIEVEKEIYKSGDIVSVEVDRTAIFDTQGTSIRELILVGDNGNKEIFRYNTNLSINSGREKISVDWLLPPKIKDGIYFFQGVVSYPVRGITKFTPFYTEKFIIKS